MNSNEIAVSVFYVSTKTLSFVEYIITKAAMDVNIDENLLQLEQLIYCLNYLGYTTIVKKIIAENIDYIAFNHYKFCKN